MTDGQTTRTRSPKNFVDTWKVSERWRQRVEATNDRIAGISKFTEVHTYRCLLKQFPVDMITNLC